MSVNQNTVQQNNEITKAAFSIPYYMTSLVLPKCVMVYGEVISSVYLQIALYVNHQKDIPYWKRNSSWIKPKTIAINTGYNVRVVNSTIKILETLQLIQVKSKGKLTIFNLYNNQFKTHEEIKKFNNNLESILLLNMNKTRTHKYITLFRRLEEMINFNDALYVERVSRSIWFPDINLFRNWLNQSEKIYKGSSLFFVNHIALQFYYNNNSLYQLSEQDRALLIGSSQSTISRYISRFLTIGFLIIKKNDMDFPVELSLNIDFKIDENKFNKDVVIDVEKLTCPICQKEFNEGRSLSIHISKANDKKHSLLNNLKKQTKSKIENLEPLYLEYKEDFDQLNNMSTNEDHNEYLKIPCDCKMSCKECYKNWKLDFYNDCKHERKDAYNQEYNIVEKSKQPINHDFDVVKPVKTKKPLNNDTAPGLVKYFYTLTGGASPNWGKECGQVKNILNKSISSEDIRITMEYLNRKGNIDLRFLNRSIQEALLEKQYLTETEQNGTPSYLVKMYYDGMKVPLNIQTLIRDVQKIKETMNTGLTYEQTKLVVQYMIDIKCPTLNFIGSKRTEALAKMVKKNLAQENPSFFDRSDLVIIKSDLINGRTNLRKINDQFKPDAKDIARQIFKDNDFSNKYTHFEWAWKVGLELDDEMYRIAINTKNSKQMALDKILSDPSISDEQRESISKIKNRFDDWMNKQIQTFGYLETN